MLITYIMDIIPSWFPKCMLISYICFKYYDSFLTQEHRLIAFLDAIKEYIYVMDMFYYIIILIDRYTNIIYY